MQQVGHNYIASLIALHNSLFEREQAGEDIAAELADYNAQRATFGLPPVESETAASEAPALEQGKPLGS